MRLAFDIEANGLHNPTKIWLVVAKDMDTGEYHTFRRPSDDLQEKKRLLSFLSRATLLVGHNILGYDLVVMGNLLSFVYDIKRVIDTLVISKLVDYPRTGHSIQDYGLEFGLEKGEFNDFSKYSPEMEAYCVRDVDICCRIYAKYNRYISNPDHSRAIDLEQRFQIVCNELTANGFAFNKDKADKLLERVKAELAVLDKDIHDAFPERLRLVREITPKQTKFGTLSRTDFRWVADGDLTEYNGGPFCRCSWECFNPSSHRQIIDVLHTAGWTPVDKTKSHIDAERDYNRLKRYSRVSRSDGPDKEETLHSLELKIKQLKITGWKVNEANLETLPASAPKPARLLAQRIMYEARRRTLTEWIELCGPDGRIHPNYIGLGAWTHRTATQKPNAQNIPNEYDITGKKKLLGKELRSLWIAPRGRLLVGCDAEGIQLRIFAHYINDPEFTDALVQGRKDDKTDPHSLNQRILGSPCKSRAAAKRFIYALLLGAGLGKLSEILGCSDTETQQALDRLISRYEGWATLKSEVFPKDAKRGWFIGLDGRKVRIPGDTEGNRKHLAMSGYLQNGEAIVVKKASVWAHDKIKALTGIPVGIIHDENQDEGPNNMTICIQMAEIRRESIRWAGIDLGLKCPLEGSFWNDDHNDYTIGTNWSQTH